MDPAYVDPEEDADAMARFMGFSSFGAQGPTKRRKFNVSTDAVVEGQDLAALDKGGKRGHGSGGNHVPLGKTRQLGVAAAPVDKMNRDAIDLDDEEEADDGGVNINAPATDGAVDEDLEPSYIDTSLAPPNEEAKAAQEQIDAILAGTSAASGPTASRGRAKVSLPGRGIGQFLSALRNLDAASAPPLAAESSAVSSSAPGRNDGQRSRDKGQRNELWYIGYYDPSFNENPWDRLEKARGLQSRGSWVVREQRVI